MSLYNDAGIEVHSSYHTVVILMKMRRVHLKDMVELRAQSTLPRFWATKFIPAILQ